MPTPTQAEIDQTARDLQALAATLKPRRRKALYDLAARVDGWTVGASADKVTAPEQPAITSVKVT